jgi:hypothetical protein
MQRDDRVARCALLAWAGDWELRVLVDGEILLAERCARSDEAFTLADKWKRRMLDRSWQQVLPRSAQAVELEDRRPA